MAFHVKVFFQPLKSSITDVNAVDESQRVEQGNGRYDMKIAFPNQPLLSCPINGVQNMNSIRATALLRCVVADPTIFRDKMLFEVAVVHCRGVGINKKFNQMGWVVCAKYERWTERQMGKWLEGELRVERIYRKQVLKELRL